MTRMSYTERAEKLLPKLKAQNKELKELVAKLDSLSYQDISEASELIEKKYDSAGCHAWEIITGPRHSAQADMILHQHACEYSDYVGKLEGAWFGKFFAERGFPTTEGK